MEISSYILSIAQRMAEGKLNFSEAESEIFRFVQALGCLVFEEVIKQADELLYEQGEHGTSQGFREMGMLTLFGEIVYRRRLYKRETQWIYALDQVLGVAPKQTISPMLTKAAAYMATENSYRQSARMLEQMGISISHQRVHQAVQDLGEAIEHREEARTRVEGSKREPDIVVVESDGIHVGLQGEDRKRHKGSLEIKVGCVYEGWEAADPSGTRYRLRHPRVMGTAETADKYWEKLDRYLQNTYDLERVGLMVFGSDGAPWGKQGAELYEGSVHQIDRFHFKRWITRVFGFRSKEIVDTIEALVLADDRAGFQALMAKKREGQAEKKAKAIQQLEGTILRNWESIKDYRTRGVALPPVARGIGNIENANDNLVADRMKKRGMSWSVKGAHNLVQVKAAVRNGEWEEITQWIIQHNRQLEERGTETVKADEGQKRRGRPTKGKRRQETTGAWCQAHMPGLEGSEQWLREFSRSFQQVVNPAM